MVKLGVYSVVAVSGVMSVLYRVNVCTVSVKKSVYSIFPPKFPKSFKHLEKYMQNIRVLLITTLATELSAYFKSNLMSYVMGNTSFITQLLYA